METIIGPPRPATGTEPAPQGALRPGARIVHDRFTVGAPLMDEAPGAYFAVYDHLTNNPALLRALLLAVVPGEGAMQRMRHDIRRVAASPHPYILRVLESDVRAGMLLLVTEPRGVPLRQILAQERLGTGAVLTFAAQIAGALGFAHAHGVVHGRLTPATVAIIDGTARLADVGLHHLVPAFADPWPGDQAARPGYSAPEEAVDPFPAPALDVFHFGALLCEMLYGAPPQAGVPFAPPARPELPTLLAALVAGCLHPDPAARPHGMGEIVALLRAARSDLATGGRGGSLARLHPRHSSSPLLSDVAEEMPLASPARPLTETRPTIAILTTPSHSVDDLPTHYLAASGVSASPKDSASSGTVPPVPPLSTTEATAPFAVLQTTPIAALPPLPLARVPRGQWWRLPTVRLAHLPLAQKVGLVGGLGVTAIAIIAIASGALFTYAAPPRDGITLHAGITDLAPRSAPYHVTTTLTITPGHTLRLAAGTTLLFAPGAGLVVAGGALEAHGTAAAPVVFAARDDTGENGARPGAWVGIQLVNGSSGSPGRALLDGIALRDAGSDGAAITCHAGALTLSHSSQSDSPTNGLVADTDCWGAVTDTTFARDGAQAAVIANAGLAFHDDTLNGLPVSLP